jgi:uncharacterized RDD family membrane protein YckC
MNTTNPYAPPRAAVEDVAEPVTGEPAGRLIRLGTAILDGIVAMLLIGLPIGISMALSGAAIKGGHFNYAALGGMGALFGLLGLTAYIWLNVLFVARNGQSKKITGIKVVRSDGSPASLGRIFWLRNVLGGVLGSIPRIGFLFALLDPLFIFGQTRQCLHDRFADTIVIKA